MKKILSTVLLLTLCASLMFALTSCGHECDFDTDWKSDATNHWHECNDKKDKCEEIGDKAAHSFAYTKDASQHWQVCSVCGYSTSKDNHTWVEGDKVSHGVYGYSCSVCGQTKTETVATTISAEDYAALDYGTNYSTSLYGTYDGVTMEIIVKRDGNKAAMIQRSVSDAETDEDVSYALIEGETVYNVVAEYDDNGALISCVKSPMGTMTPDQFFSMLQQSTLYMYGEFLLNFEDYTYDEASKLYVSAEQFVIQEFENYSLSLANAKMGFEAGKLVSVTFDMVTTVETETSTISMTYAVTYGGASVQFPAEPTLAEAE